MATEIKQFKPAPNWDILNFLRDGTSGDYQRRVPDATKANVQQTIKDMWNYSPTRNEFIDAFINKIGMEVARNLSWSNPLGIFKIGMLEYGDTIEEYIVGLIEATTYDPNRDSLERDVFGQAEGPDVQTSYHKVNRMDKYKLTINEPLLKRAFLSDYGLSSLVVQLMQSLQTSDQVDEFKLMTSLFREYYDNGGFFVVNVPDIAAETSTKEQTNYFLRRVRGLQSSLQFVSTAYNAAGMPVVARPDELFLFTTPDGLAAIDVESLAAAFNVSSTDLEAKIMVIPPEDFNIPGAVAVLTTKDFFVVADQRLESTSIYNPDGLYSNYWYHHWQVISVSRFVPAILFSSTDEGTLIGADRPEVTGIEAIKLFDNTGVDVTSAAKAERGKFYTISTKALTEGYNDAVRFDFDSSTIPESQRTFVVNTGTLYVAPDEDRTSIKVNAYATDDNSFVASITLTIVGTKAEPWPLTGHDIDTDLDGTFEVTPEPVPAAPTSGAQKNKVTIPDAQEGFDYKDGATVVNGQTLTLTANKTITAVAKAGYEFASGATTSWTLTYTA